MESTLSILTRLEMKLSTAGKQSSRRKVVVGFESAPVLSSALELLDVPVSRTTEMTGVDELKRVGFGCDAIALVGWANSVHAEDLWEDLINNILIPSRRRDYKFFFDLGDPAGKCPYDIDDILDLISRFSFCGRVTLGLSEKEAISIWSALTGKAEFSSIEEIGRFLHYAMNIDCVLIHNIDRCLVFHQRELLEVPARKVVHSDVYADAGDYLNAGYVLGMLSELSINESVALGMATAGAYLLEGKGASLTGIENYITLWKQELVMGASRHQEGQLIS